MNCPLLENTKEYYLIKEVQRLNTEMREKDILLDELVKENKSYRERYFKRREDLDKNDWGI